MSRGYFISFEGIDGAGKSTHIEGLRRVLHTRGHTVLLTREPGGSALAEKLRALILGDSMDALTETLLVFAARRDHIVQVIGPALARGEVILCDRFTDASFAYQGGGRGEDTRILQTLEHWVQGDAEQRVLQPDLTFWFDVDPHTAARRLAAARVPDRFERESVDFFDRVRQAYARRAEQNADRFVRLEASFSREQVFAQLLEALKTKGVL